MRKSIEINHEYTLTGYLVLSALINGALFSQKFQGFTLSEAKQIFKAKFNI